VVAGSGIDFGTSNTLIAVYSDSGGSKILPISQRIEKNIAHTDTALPSAVYLNEDGTLVVGSYALKMNSTDPDRGIISVKSWLCNHLVSRNNAILPWGNDTVHKKFTPLEIASEIISHAIRSVQGSEADTSAFTNPEIRKVLTIPASFDEVARELTKQAAALAGLNDFIFLEEPLAALYSWLSEHEHDWRDFLALGDLILVCDIGGGTTDFTLVGVTEKEGQLFLERYSVGDHILLGGDNIDLALSYFLQDIAEDSNTPLDSWQKKASVHILRELKEKALSDKDTSEENYHIAIPSRSANLFTKTLGFTLPRSFFIDKIFNGFFPEIEIDEEKISDEAALSDSGLPYEPDPRFTVHLLSFLRQSYRSICSSTTLRDVVPEKCMDHTHTSIIPNKILFNGGVCNAPQTRERIVSQMFRWFPENEVSILPSESYEQSVAKGAAYYSYLKSSGKDIPVKAGISHSLYLGIRENTLAIPGIKPKIKGICILPQGTPEGSEFIFSEMPLSLQKGRTSEFILYSSKERREDIPGSIVGDAEKQLVRHHTVTSHISDDNGNGVKVPVTLRVKATEAGSLELWMDEISSDTSHQVEFKIR
jgi:hypothetical protein